MKTKNATNYSIDWKNVDLDDNYQASQTILDAYTFNILLLEIECNLPTINKETIRKQFNKEMQSKINSANEVLNNNLDNILRKAVKTRKIK